MPQLSIIIPTNRSPDVLEPCLRSVAGQRFDPREIEVCVVFNGMRSTPQWREDAWPFRLVVGSIAEANIGAAKNAALERARGEWILLINDDVRLEPNCVAAHLATHRGLHKPAMVLGLAKWQEYADATVFDHLIQSTSMIFFYDRLEPYHWYNFRHAWNLNVSVARRYCDDVRFDETLKPVNFDDVEWAFRQELRNELRVWYEPAAASVHDHRYTLDGYLTRETHLGRMAVTLWRCNPDCFRAIYGSDLDDGYVAYCRQYVHREGGRETELRAELRAVVERPAAELAGGWKLRRELLRALYNAHLPLKRLAFRRGLLSALNGSASRERTQNAECPAG